MANSSDSSSLRQRVIGASVWSVGGFAVNLSFRFASNLLMTRLLAPDMFGVMAVATVVMSTLAVFSDIGLKQSVVQSKRGNEDLFLNTIWTIQILRGLQLAFWVLLVAAAIQFANSLGFVATSSVYADSRVPYVVAATSITAIITGLTSTKLLEANRNLTIQRVAIIEIAAQILGLACMLGWIAVDRSIWALVVGGIVSSTVATVLSHVWLVGHGNRWQWDKSAAIEIIQFGKWIMLTSIVGALIANADRLLLAGMINATDLGIYAIAFTIFLSIEQLLMRIVSGIAYPALSEVVRNRRHDLKAAYYRVHNVVALLAYLGGGLLITSSQALIDLLYDHRYADAGWMLQILAVGLLAVPFQIAMQSFLALNKPKFGSLISVIRLTALVIALPLGFRLFGLTGALIGSVASIFICLPAISYLSYQQGLFDLRRELLPIPALALGLGAGKLLAAVLSLI